MKIHINTRTAQEGEFCLLTSKQVDVFNSKFMENEFVKLLPAIDPAHDFKLNSEGRSREKLEKNGKKLYVIFCS